MIGHGFRARVCAAGVVVCAATGAASAQFAHFGVASPGVPCVTGECGTVGRGSRLAALCGRTRHPCYRPVECGPTIIPGTPYGHFETKWRRWEDHAGGCAAGVPAGVVIGQPVPPPAPPAEPMPVPKPDVLLPPTQLPKTGDAKPADPVAPPKLPVIPKQVNAEMPAVPVPMPPIPQSTTSDKPALEIPTRVIIPPLPDLPTKR